MFLKTATSAILLFLFIKSVEMQGLAQIMLPLY